MGNRINKIKHDEVGGGNPKLSLLKEKETDGDDVRRRHDDVVPTSRNSFRSTIGYAHFLRSTVATDGRMTRIGGEC